MATFTSPITLRDVAQKANCSTAVVSTVVNNAKGNTLVSSETRQRVLRVAKELGYRPNFASRSLVRRRTRTLGIYIPPSPWAGVGFTYESLILRGVESATQARGYDLLLLNLTGQQDAQTCLSKVAERRVDGLLIIHAEQLGDWVDSLLQTNPNVVAVDYGAEQLHFDAIGFDNAAVGQTAVDHLHDLGHRRIGFLGSCRQPIHQDAAARQAGFVDAMARHGLTVDPAWIFDLSKVANPLRPEQAVCQIEAQMAAQYILGLGARRPTAWIAYNDLVAVHLIRHLQAAGLKLPEQLSVVGVDDSEWCSLSSPALTSVRHPLEQMGRCAANLLIEKSEGQARSGKGKSQRIVFPPEMAVRESTAPCRS